MSSLGSCISRYTKGAKREEVKLELQDLHEGHLKDKVDPIVAKKIAVQDALNSLNDELADITKQIRKNIEVRDSKDKVLQAENKQIIEAANEQDNYSLEDTIATEYSLATKTSTEALDAFDNDYKGKKLTQLHKRARQILVDAVEIDSRVFERFKGEYPDGLSVLEKAVNSTDKNISALSKFLLSKSHIREKLSKVDVQKAISKGSRFSGDFGPNGTIFLQTTGGEVGIHEVVHAITANEMKSNPDLRAEVRGMMDVVAFRMVKAGVFTRSEMETLEATNKYKDWNKLGWKKNREVAYAMLNEDEFLAQAFSSHQFQKILKNISVGAPTLKTKRSIWQSLLDVARKALGLNPKNFTMLDKALTIVPEIAQAKADKKASSRAALEGPPTKKTREDQVAVMIKNDHRGRPADILKDWRSRAADTIKDLGKGVTERLRKIDPFLIRPLRQMEFAINDANRAYQVEVKPFIDGYNKLSKEDKVLLDLTLMNREKEDIATRNEILRKNGLTSAYKKVEAVLEKIHKEKAKVGLNSYKDIASYFPRRVKDVRGLMQTIKDDKTYNVIQAELDRLGEDATEVDKENALQQMIHTGRFPALALIEPSASKRRTIRRVSSEWKHHYENASDTLINHIYESNEAIYARQLFGDVHRKKIVQKRDELYKKLEGDSVTGKRARKKIVAQIQLIEDKLADFEGDFREGILQLLQAKAPDMNTRDADEVIRLIRARLGQKGMTGPAATIRNLSLMSVLSSPTSAITQIGDLAFSIYKYGLGDTIGAITGEKVITPKDLDLSHSMKEFQSEGTAKWLDKTLKWSGLQFMDTFGKTTTMNAAFANAKKMSLKQFTEKYEHAMQEDTVATYNDIKAGKNTKLTRYFVFNELSNLQPVSMSEMPLKYLEAGNGRIFYALKSYNIKAMNTIYRESVHNWRTAKTKEGKQKAARDVGRLVLLMVLAGATADELKDMLLGKDAGTFSDSMWDNLFKIGFMSRYTMDQGFSKGIAKTFVQDILMPPTGFVDDPLSDIASWFGDEPDLETVNNLPWGKIPYSWFSSVEEKKDMGKLKKQITEAIKKGESISSQSDLVRKYNRWALDQDDEKQLKYGTLVRARREYLKGN